MRKINKRIKLTLASITISVFVFSGPVHATNLYIKMSLGINTGGVLQDILRIPSQYSPYITLENNPKPKLGMDTVFEILYHFTPRIGLSFGYGYLSGGKTAETAEITAVGLDFPFQATPRFDWEANAIYVTGIYALPLSQSINLNLGIGAAYYLAKLKDRTAWVIHFGYSGELPNDTYNWDQTSENWGFHITSGLDFTLFENMFFTIDLMYRYAEFDAHTINLETGPITTITFLEWVEEQQIPYTEYEVTQVGITGIAIRAGLKFRF